MKLSDVVRELWWDTFRIMLKEDGGFTMTDVDNRTKERIKNLILTELSNQL
jgi:hypothetical protein